MRIDKILLYSKTGDLREIDTSKDVNFIVGPKKTGKSAIGSIISYVLGSSKCNVPISVITDTVEWYALVIKFEEEYMLVARRNPKEGFDTTNEAYYKTTTEPFIPAFAEIKKICTIEDILNIIGNKLGIQENLHIPDKQNTRRELSANLKHALFYCIQEQNEIAAKDFLFHESHDHWKRQALKDTLPYFLKVYSKEYMDNLKKEKELKKILRLLEKEELTYNNFVSEITNSTKKLVSELKSLYPNIHITIEDTSDELTILKKIQDFKPNKDVYEFDIEAYEKMNTDYEKNSENIAHLNLLIAEYDKYSQTNALNQDEFTHQKKRLESIGIFSLLSDGNAKSPFTNEKLPSDNELQEVMVSELEKIKNNIELLSVNILDYKDKISGLKEDKRILFQNQLELGKLIMEFEESNIEMKKFNDKYESTIRVIAKAEFLYNNIKDNELESNQEKIENIQSELSGIQELLDKDRIRDRITEELSIVSDYITDFSKGLDLEYANAQIILDYSKLLCKIVTENKTIYQNKVGSASNWISIHLAAHLGIHKYFIENNSPVPKFLFIDQPSQAYFPNSFFLEGKDIEYEIVKKIFKSVINIAVSIGLQVIVVDHAIIADKLIESYTSEVWNTVDKKLIPLYWIK